MCNNDTNQMVDISTLQFIRKLHNFMHIVSACTAMEQPSQCSVPVLAGYVDGYRAMSGSGEIFKILVRYIPTC